MIEKTPLMKQYEKENPGKHAIWNDLITEQFKIWKAKKEDPNYNARYIYEDEDGFKIKRTSLENAFWAPMLRGMSQIVFLNRLMAYESAPWGAVPSLWRIGLSGCHRALWHMDGVSTC